MRLAMREDVYIMDPMQETASRNTLLKSLKARLDWSLLLIMGAGLFIRCYNLSSILFYWDEPIHSVRIAYQPLAYVLQYNNASALFSVLLHFLLPGGKLELMARLPSVIFGILLIPLIYYGGKKFFSPRVGRIAAALTAFSPFLIRFSQYARTYATFVFFAFLMLILFVRARQENRIKLWIAYSAVTLITVYSHLMGFLAFSGIGLYAGIQWLLEVRRHKTLRSRESAVFLRFLVFTLAAFSLAAVLYSQDINVKGFLSASVDRVQNQTAISSLIPYIAKKIFNEQMLLKPYFHLPMLMAIFIGLAGSLKKYRAKIGFFLLYILLPFTIFVAIKPRTVNIQSAERYFIFILPVILLLAARGIEVLTDLKTAWLQKFLPAKGSRSFLSRIIPAALCVLLIWGFQHQHYYLNFWRFGAHPIKTEVREHLQKYMKQDSVILIDSFPASGHTLVANPLSRAVDLQQSEILIRSDFLAPEEKNQVMIYRINASTLKPLGKRHIDLWVISEPGPKNCKKLLAAGQDSPHLSAVQIGDSVLLHFADKYTLLGDKLQQYTRLYRRLDLSTIKQKELHLMAAKFHLIYGQASAAYQEIDQAGALDTELPAVERPSPGPVYSVLDRLFGLTGKELYDSYFDWFYYQNIARFLFDIGEHLHQAREFQQARSAYERCLQLSRQYDQRIASRLFQLANNYLAGNSPDKAVPLYRQAAALNKDRFIFRLLWAEALKMDKKIPAAEELYADIFAAPWLLEPVRSRLMGRETVCLLVQQGSQWRIIFRGSRGTVFAGKIVGEQKVAQLMPDRFSSRDTAVMNGKELNFHLTMDKRLIKVLEFRTKGKGRISLDLQINGQADPSSIMLLNTGEVPDRLPFIVQ